MRAMKYVTLSLCLGRVLMPTMAAADPVAIASAVDSAVTAPQNGHQYAVVLAEGVSWETALAATSLLSDRWQLATITSAAEQDFVVSLGLPGTEFWLGGFQDPISTAEAGANWTWVTGEAFVFTNWKQVPMVEPNDFPGPASEQYLGIIGSSIPSQFGTWNDEGFRPNISGYIIERASPAPVSEPAPWSMTLLGLTGFCAARLMPRHYP